MSKFFKSISATPAFLIAFIFLAGCANDQYALEKAYWRAQKLAQKILKNPYVSPPKEVEEAVKNLNNFSERYSQTKFAVLSQFTIAGLYMAKEEYDIARGHLKALIDKYRENEGARSEAIFMLGNTYEKQNKWAPALEQYNRLIKEYPMTVRGFGMPLYIAGYYKEKYQPEKMMEAFKAASVFYNEIANKYSDTKIAFFAHSNVVKCYAAIKDWQGAVSMLNLMLEKYKGKVPMDGALLEMAVVYSRQLNDKAKARQALNSLMAEYPKSKFLKVAAGMLKELGKE